ncbi:ABC transporter substrate-binding protein [Naasia sp. SYSU D00948]|uniref:ABC transporter substrate-binding protein n=1 Tax=Naasia sp. SYSU D00948 TaxID=2817379 RepID=UPI001B3026B5|nr:ABC transporter substrate-binding protein [Naasia sp. SYSU D00948]
MRQRPRTTLPLALGLTSMIALSGCAAGSASSSSGERVEGGTIVYAHQQEPPCVFGGWIEQAYLSYQVLDNLVSLDEDGEVVPWLAEEWSASEDGLTWTFTLQEGVQFTDGTPVDAEAIAYNFDYWVAGGNSTAQVWLQDYYESANAVDERTVEIHLKAPYPRLADNLTQGYFGIQSQHALETRSDEENCAAPIGSGAFTVEHWTRGQNITLVRNDEYTSWPANAEHTGPAYVERIDWRFVPDGTTRVAALQSGEVDAVYDVPAVQWQSVEDGGFELHRYITPGRPQQLSFDTKEGPFTDQLVRQAFAYSLDREEIVGTIGHGVIPWEGNGGVSQATPGYSEKAAGWYSYDPDRANELLDEAGWTERNSDGVRLKDGEPLKVVLPYGAGSILNADGAAILQGVKEQASEVGFDVELVPVPQSELFAGAYSTPEERDFEVGYWTSVTAGILYINWRPSTEEAPNYNNGAFYDDPELAAIILEANSTADVEAQNALYAKAQEYIAERALAIGLYDRLSTLAVDPSLRGVWQEHAQGGPTFYDAHFVQ